MTDEQTTDQAAAAAADQDEGQAVDPADDKQAAKDLRAAQKHPSYQPGVNETALGYVNPASLPEQTVSEDELVAARGVVDEDDGEGSS